MAADGPPDCSRWVRASGPLLEPDVAQGHLEVEILDRHDIGSEIDRFREPVEGFDVVAPRDLDAAR